MKMRAPVVDVSITILTKNDVPTSFIGNRLCRLRKSLTTYTETK
jgi:hypothetical protein